MINERRQIQSIARAFSIIELFNKYRKELSILEISNEVCLPKSTVHGIVATLYDLGYLKQNKDNSKYSLGYKFITLYTTFVSMTDLVSIAKPYLEKLVADTNETTHLAILQNGDTFYIDKVQPASGLAVSSQIGTCLPAYCTGIGKAMLAFCSEDEVRRIVKEKGIIKRTKNTITDVDILLSELKEIRESCLSFDNEEYDEGLSCIAAPIFDHKANVIAAISLAGPTVRVKRNKKEYIERIITMAQSISNKLGYQKHKY